MKGAFVARERPTASEDQLSSRARTVTAHNGGLTRSQAHAQARCAPLRRPGQPGVRCAGWDAPADRSNVPKLRRQVALFASRAGMADEDLAELQVAVSEALTNAVLHAYRDREYGGDVHVDVEISDGELMVRVRDYGCGLQPRPDSPGVGLGLSIIARLCKRHCIRRCDGGGTEVGMCFDLEGGATR